MNGRKVRVAIVYHSRAGHTAAIAQHVAKGAGATDGAEGALVDVEAGALPWDMLHGSGAIVFGSPTHFGGVSAEMKRFMDATDSFWREMRWRDKLAAAFTCAGEPSGDKLSVLLQLAIFAGQHGMIWVGTDPMTDSRTGTAKPKGYNRHGGYLGAMADAVGTELGPHSPPAEDRATAELLGRRVATLACRWAGAAGA